MEYNLRLQKSLEHRVRIDEGSFKNSDNFSSSSWPQKDDSEERIDMVEGKKDGSVKPAWTEVFENSVV